MPFAQRALERRVQLLGLDGLALLQVELHQFGVDLDHLVHQRVMRGRHAQEVGLPRRIEEAVHHLAAARGRQVDRQTLLAERFLDVGQQCGQVHLFAVDAVDDDHPAQLARLGPGHGAPRGHFDAGLRIDDDGRGFDRWQGAMAWPEKSG